MTWIVTADGNELDLRCPRPEHITITAIAHALAQINRFTGHARRPYSVAEHSLLVADIVAFEFELDVHAQLAALMHDAHEAFSGDMHTPGKSEIGLAWHEWEHRWERTVRSAFAIQTASVAHAAAIRRADLIALATERRDLLPGTPEPWPALDGIAPVEIPNGNLMSHERCDARWLHWRARFLARYHELEQRRNALLFPRRAAH